MARTTPDVDLTSATVIEYRPEGNVVGLVEYGEMDNGQAGPTIGWNDAEGSHGHRTTIFDPRSWKWERKAHVLSFTRTGPDTGIGDVPWRTADRYTIVLPRH